MRRLADDRPAPAPRHGRTVMDRVLEIGLPSQLLAASWIAAVAVMALSYLTATAQTGPVPISYTLFWVSMGLAFIPTTCLVVGATVVAAPRSLAVVTFFALFTYLPKVLRSPARPAFGDEIGQYAATEQFLRNGDVFEHFTLIPALRFYPGLRLLTAGVFEVTRLPLWTCCLVLILGAHVAALFGVRALAMDVLRDRRAATLAALVYAASPSFLFFTAIYAYESLALPLLIWALVLTVRARRAQTRRSKYRYTAGALLCGLYCSITHHVTSFALVAALLMLLVLGAVTRLRRSVDRRPPVLWPVAVVTGVVVAFNAAWFTMQGTALIRYIFPSPSALLDSFVSLVHSSGGGKHRLYSGSTLPEYEKLFGLAAPILATALIGVGLLRRKQILNPVLRRAVTAVAVCYPISIPLEFSSTGQQIAHRSWPFSYIGASIVIAIGLLAVRVTRPTTSRHLRRLNPRYAAAGLVFALLIGNTANDANPTVRFPGPAAFGSTAGFVDAKALALASWCKANLPADARVLADPNTATALVAYAGEQWVQPFPQWAITFYPYPTPPPIVARLEVQHVQYLVVDKRMYSRLSASGFYYESDEPLAFARTRPVGTRAYRVLLRQPWLVPVHFSQRYTVFAVRPFNDTLVTNRLVEIQKRMVAAALKGSIY